MKSFADTLTEAKNDAVFTDNRVVVTLKNVRKYFDEEEEAETMIRTISSSVNRMLKELKSLGVSNSSLESLTFKFKK